MKCQKQSVKRKVRLVRALYRSAPGWMALIFCVFSLSSPLWAHESNKPSPIKSAIAVRINPDPPQIDGVLDDKIWQKAPIFTGFIQGEPNEGETATEKTTFQIAYDDEALYIGVMAYDTEPDKIVSRLGRREQLNDADTISVDLDPHHDHQTGYYFMINPAGTVGDGIFYDDTQWDNTWDGVWEARAASNDKGWSAEYKIPYHVLRFSPKEEYIWGLNVNRFISRKKERVYWVMVPRIESGRVSRFGHLEGIKGIQPPTHLEVLPFTLARSTFEPESQTNPDGREFFPAAGADLRYGISSNISLNAAINPDFGQVEADPAVLNLSVFETFFEERRPFFVEGATIFQNDDYRLFYSRRIGKQSGHFSTPAGSTLVDRPDATNILGAVKLTGKTAGKTSFGILNAVTAEEYATIKEKAPDAVTGEERPIHRRHLIEPLTNYFVGRIYRDVLEGNSRVGFLTTAVNRRNAESAYMGDVDWKLRFRRNAWQFAGTVSVSRSGLDEDRKSGYLTHIEFGKNTGWLRSEGFVAAISPDFDINDLGFIDRTNCLKSFLWFGARKERPWGRFFRRSQFNLGAWSNWNYDGVDLSQGVNFNTWHQLKNFWWIGIGATRDLVATDDLGTRGGPVMVDPARVRIWFDLQTDSRKPISFDLGTFWERSDEGPSYRRRVKLQANIRPASYIRLEISPQYQSNSLFVQWVKNVEAGDGTTHYVFGELENQVIDFTTRAMVSFTPSLSLQIYLQPFVAVGDYGQIKELARPESYDFIPFSGLDQNPDFSRRALRSNVVLRWEYRPGSTLFVVWSQSRRTSLDIDNPSLQPWHGIRDSFTDDGSNIFLVRFNYWMGL